MSTRKMHFITLNCCGPTDHNNGGWRHPDGDGHLVLDPSRYEEIGRISEKGLFDGMFFVDYMFHQGLTPGEPSRVTKYGGQMVMLDPLQVLAAVARVTKHIGLAATMSTSLYPPYHIARAFASLDHISGGRAGWNIVTSSHPAEANNFGMSELGSRGSRYDHADEVMEACMTLWKTWDIDALKFDKANGIFADSEKMRYVKYAGTEVSFEGGLTTPQPPQGKPVFMQAGSSPRGREFAARWAEVIFTVQNRKELMQTFYQDMKQRAIAAGRNPDECRVMPAIDLIVGETEREAIEKAEFVDSLASVDLGVQTLCDLTGVDLRQLPLDTIFEDVPVDQERISITGVYQNVCNLRVNGNRPTIEQAARHFASTWMSPRLVGTPDVIADQMQDFFESGACDGFIIGTSTSPMGLRNFVDHVIPELQRRKLFRTEYTGGTFRENLLS